MGSREKYYRFMALPFLALPTTIIIIGIRALASGLLAGVSSAYQASEEVPRAKEAGYQLFLEKPIHSSSSVNRRPG
jgi:hypothetical protein